MAAVAKKNKVSEQTISPGRPSTVAGLEPSDVKKLKALEGRERQAEEVARRARPRDRHDARGGPPKVVSLPVRRQQVGFSIERGISQRRACRVYRRGTFCTELRFAARRNGRPGDRSDEAAVGTVSAVRLSPHPDLPRPRGAHDESEPRRAVVAQGKAAVARQATAQADQLGGRVHCHPGRPITSGRTGRIKLQVERGCFDRLLLVTSQARQAVGECVRNSKFHSSTRQDRFNLVLQIERDQAANCGAC